jgi:hypothetical protein
MKNNQQASVIIWQRLVASTGHSFVYKKKLNGIFNEYTVQFLFWWAMTGSNCRHLACKASALPAELIAHKMVTHHGIEP